MRRMLYAALLGLTLALAVSCGAQSASSSVSREDSPAGDTSGQTAYSSGGNTETTTTPAAAANVEPSKSTATSPAEGASGMVSSAHPLATQAGLDILSKGGNAFDAAVAVGASLGVVEPYMSGLGAYGAIVIYDAKKGETRFLNVGSRTPASLDPSVFRPPTADYSDNRCGAKAIATPGIVRAWETMSQDYGELGWQRLFEPAVGLAENGFALDNIAANWIDAAFPYFPENAKAIYGNNGTPLRSGERLVQKDLANSLRLISSEGADAMYKGELGRAIESAAQRNGGYLTAEDLRNNSSRWQETVGIDHRGYKVVTASPPATSWAALLTLGTMSQFGLKASDHNSVAYLHAFTEAAKQTSRTARSSATDPDVQATPLDRLLSEQSFAAAAANIDPSQASPITPSTALPAPTRCPPQSYTTTSPANPQPHTTHFVVADKEGNVVSATQTIGDIFGSKVMPEGTGIWLNDALGWSRFEPAGNVFDVYPGRQSLYAISPTLVMKDNKPVAAIGTPGGRTIVQTTPQMLMNYLDFGMDIQQAISAPRVSFVYPDKLVAENDIPQPVRDGLASLGHNVQVDDLGLGNAHGLTIEYDAQGRPVRFTGGSDPRGQGVAEGY